MRKRCFIFVFILGALFSVFTAGYTAGDRESDPVEPIVSGESTVVPDDKDREEAVKKLELQEKEAEAKIDQQTEDVIEAQKAIEEVKAEKEALTKEVRIKEEEAKIAQEELEVLKEEAAVLSDSKSIETVEELEEKVRALQAEAASQRKMLSLAGKKEDIAQERLIKEQSEIEQIQKELEDLKIKKSGLSGPIEKLIRSVVIIFVAIILFILLKLGVKALGKAITREHVVRESEIELRMKTLGNLFSWLGGIIIVLSAVYQLLSIYGFNVGPLIAGAGVLGLAFGFGGQYLIRDIINGLFILVEGQYRINDVVKIGDLGGLVEDINLRITTLRDLAGRVIIIPNGEIKTVINFTRGYAQALMDIGVAYKENVDQVIEIIKRVGNEMRKDEYFGRLILDDLEMLGVDDFANSAVMIKFRIKTRPIKQWEVSREFRRRIKNRFDELGIEIPFPHTTVYWGTDKENQWLKESIEKMAGGIDK
jgi:small conductance mechanosensitive channel